MTTFNQVAVSAIRLAALTQLGPLAANFFATSALAEAGAAVLTELTGGAAAGFFQSALPGFSREHNHDLEKSLHQARIASFACAHLLEATTLEYRWQPQRRKRLTVSMKRSNFVL